MTGLIRLGSGAVLKNASVPNGCVIQIEPDAENVVIENVTTGGVNLDRVPIRFAGQAENVTVDGKRWA